MAFHKIATLPEPVRPMLVDMAEEFGAMKAVKMLQEILADLGYDIGIINGHIDKHLIMVALQAEAMHGDGLVHLLVERRIRYYRRIVARHPEKKVFLDGWLARAERFRPR